MIAERDRFQAKEVRLQVRLNGSSFSDEKYLYSLYCIRIPEIHAFWMKLKNKLKMKLKVNVAIGYSVIVSLLRKYGSENKVPFIVNQ